MVCATALHVRSHADVTEYFLPSLRKCSSTFLFDIDLETCSLFFKIPSDAKGRVLVPSLHIIDNHPITGSKPLRSLTHGRHNGGA